MDHGQFWTAKAGLAYLQRIMIKQIKFVSIPVRDQNRAKSDRFIHEHVVYM